MTGEIALAAALSLVIGLARWREHQWHRSPLGQAQVGLDRARRVRLRQSETLGRWHAFEWGVLVVAGVLFVAWAFGEAR
jgi:hypothetical protein